MGTDLAIRHDHRAKYHGGEINPQFVVIHHTAGRYPGDLDTLAGRGKAKVSAHFYITRSGEVFKLLPTTCMAYHAGVSRWKHAGKLFNSMNRYSIGIELENLDGNKHAYTEEQILALEKLAVLLARAIPVLRDPDRWIGHEHVSPGRKIDPGKLFPWARLRGVIEGVEK